MATHSAHSHRSELFNDCRFPLEPRHDFQIDGSRAEYVSGHPKEWADEMEFFEFGSMMGSDSEEHSSYHTAISPDGKLLAISSNQERILIYDVGNREVRQVLEGTGNLFFRPNGKDAKDENASKPELQEAPAYTLVSSLSDDAYRGVATINQLIFWELDQNGRLLDEEEPINASAFAMQAINSILPDLKAKHEWSKDYVIASSLHADFTKALDQVAADYRRRFNTVVEDGKMGKFGSVPFSSDGSLFLCHFQNRSTQRGMREASHLPCVLVLNSNTGEVVHRLSGHTDAIMWSGFSPNDEHIASVSWDGTVRLYSVFTGKLLWASENSGGQSWTGSFSPDSKYIAWSSRRGQVIQVLNVADGRVIATFPEKIQHWCRCLTWNPDGLQIALCAEDVVYIWRPFDSFSGTIAQKFQASEDKSLRHLANIHHISWMKEGSLLSLETADGSKLVYNTQRNTKQLFRRPVSEVGGWVDRGFYEVISKDSGSDQYVSVDGDGKLRYWPDSAFAAPHESKRCEENLVLPKKGALLENQRKPMEDNRSDWADKGASIWTAE